MTQNAAKKYIPPSNYFKNTFCVFEEVDFEPFDAIIPDYKSKTGSLYFYSQEGMYRYSNHWGRLAHCKWRLIEKDISNSKYKLGFALWSSFFPDNDVEKLYYLEFDAVNSEITYQHKLCQHYDGKALLRTTKETQKRLKTARNILTLNNWSKYFTGHDIQKLRLDIMHELIYTNKTIEIIKRERL